MGQGIRGIIRVETSAQALGFVVSCRATELQHQEQATEQEYQWYPVMTLLEAAHGKAVRWFRQSN